GFFVRPTDPRAAERIAGAVEALARERNLKALANAASPLGEAVRFTVAKVEGKQNAEGRFAIRKEEPLPAGQLSYRFDQGERFRIEIENRSDRRVYVTLFDLAPD